MTQAALSFPWWSAPLQAEWDGVHLLPGTAGRGAGPAGVPAGLGVAVPARGDVLRGRGVQRRRGLPAPGDAQRAPSRGHRGHREATVSHLLHVPCTWIPPRRGDIPLCCLQFPGCGWQGKEGQLGAAVSLPTFLSISPNMILFLPE